MLNHRYLITFGGIDMAAMQCVTGKKMYTSRQLAEEALIDVRARFQYRETAGPVTVYQCDDCGCWHFTSKGDPGDFLNCKEVKKRIADQKESDYWDWKTRKR